MAVVIGKGSFRGFGEETKRNDELGQDNLPIEKAIGNKLQQIAYNVNRLKKLNENIGTSQDSSEMRNVLGDVIAETNQLIKDTHELVKTFSEDEPRDKTAHATWKTQVQRLKELFHDQLTDYNSIQKEIRNHQRTVIRTSLQKSGCFDIDVDESGQLVKNGEQIQAESIQAEVDLDLIKEREKAIKQLEQDIIDVNDIFKDLAGMVVDQGEMIDKVEENIEVTEVHVQEAVVDLQKADVNMSAVRKKRFCIGGIVITGILIIVLIIVLTQVT